MQYINYNVSIIHVYMYMYTCTSYTLTIVTAYNEWGLHTLYICRYTIYIMQRSIVNSTWGLSMHSPCIGLPTFTCNCSAYLSFLCSRFLSCSCYLLWSVLFFSFFCCCGSTCQAQAHHSLLNIVMVTSHTSFRCGRLPITLFLQLFLVSLFQLLLQLGNLNAHLQSYSLYYHMYMYIQMALGNT